MYYEILTEAFEQSTYLHSVGSGDVQALNHLLASTKTSHVPLDESERVATIAGWLAGSAMIDIDSAYFFAEQILKVETDES